jgi:uncharacterized protein (TIGR03382 family)
VNGRSLLAACALLAFSGAALAGQSFDPRVREMLLRVEQREEPTAEDQRIAARSLRDWRLSERTAPMGDARVGRFLESIARGQQVPPELQPLARDLRQWYLTAGGVARRMAEGPYGGRGRPPASGSPAAAPKAIDSGQYWMLFAACIAITLGGLLVSWLGRRRRRPDYRAYYS